MFLRILHLRFKYSGFKISGNSKIGKHCDIRCIKGSSVTVINSFISDGCQIIADDHSEIIIRNSYIGKDCVIVAAKSIIIESNSQIAEMVTIRDQNHNFGEQGKTILEQGFSSAPIHIEENVWIGCKSTVLKGVTIGKNTVIGANSVVTKNCDENSVYVGIPVQKLKKIINDERKPSGNMVR